MTEANGVGHNSNMRAQVINEAMAELTKLEGDRREVSEAIRSLKQTRIKGDLGMKIMDFNAAYRLYQLEGDDRAEMLDTIRETFEALGAGDQLDWVAASERANKPAEAAA